MVGVWRKVLLTMPSSACICAKKWYMLVSKRGDLSLDMILFALCYLIVYHSVVISDLHKFVELLTTTYCIHSGKVSFRIFVKGGGAKTIIVLWYFCEHVCESMHPRNLLDI